MDAEKAVGVVYVDFSQAFDTISQSIFLEKLAALGSDGYTVHWENLAGQLDSVRGGEWSQNQLVASCKQV